MKRSSWRQRLALMTAALAGGVLVSFALLSSWLTYQAKLDRLDAQLETALVPLGRPRGDGLLPNPEASLAQALGLSSRDAVAVLVIDSGRRVRYQSEQWPASLTPEDLARDVPRDLVRDLPRLPIP
ncbi:MAG: hypothetical protein HC922_07075 [Leptolyngbyaceae cyanobacterium SM2_3_12]|nr:hypothetical protein [Leptolyngbyaceae cyanobacterium SM2_3_12]